MIGKIVHEVIHIAYTNFDAGQGSSAFVHALANVLEDVWGERRQSREYPGAQGKIRAALAVMMQRGLFGLPKAEEVSPQSLIVGMLIRGLRASELGQTELLPGYEAYRQALEVKIGTEPTRRLWETALEVRSCESSERAYEIAHAIAKQLEEDSQNPLPSSNEQEKEDTEDSPAEDGDGSNASSSSDGQMDESQDGGTGSPVSPEQAGAIREALEATDDFGETDFGKAIDDEMADKGITRLHGPGAGDILDPNPGKLIDAPETTAAIRRRAMPIAAQLGIRLESLLESLRESLYYRERSGRKLDRRAVPGIPVGATRVFRRTDEEVGLNTALSILIDISGSMSDCLSDGKPAILAVEETAWALGDALHRNEVPFAITTFGSSTTRLKSFGESWRFASRRHWHKLQDSTVTHYAVRKAVADLLQQSEVRKMLLLVTDGVPSSIEETAVEIREAQRAGVEVAILFIAKESPLVLLDNLKSAGTGIQPTQIFSGEGIARQIFQSVAGAF